MLLGNPVLDPLSDALPAPLTERTAVAPPNQPATFRFPGDRKGSDSGLWFDASPPAQPVRSGNEVMYLIDGQRTFAEMARVMRTATDPSRHFVYMLGWTMYLDFPVASDGATLGQIFQSVSTLGIQLRLMLWAPVPLPVMPQYGPNELVVRRVNDMPGAQAILDGRTLGFGSHHQKVLLVNGSEGLTAFCGGVDLNPDRVFPQGINGSTQAGAPMHDVHCRIRGPAAYDVLQTFVQRWSDYVRAYSVRENATLLGRSVTLDSQPKPGRLHVQVGRTFGNSTAHGLAGPPNASLLELSPYSFAPRGETTVQTMLLRAIQAAKRFVYIEDQYLVNPEASAALARVVANLSHITILIPHPDISDMPRVWELRRNFIAPLRKAGGKKVRVFVRYPYGANVSHSYVHAKTWVFDDQFAVIGSANCGLRSWTHDSEIGVGIYDESTNDHASLTFAHRLRMQLWAEHLNMDTPEGLAQLLDGVASSVHWGLPGTSVTPYDENSGHDVPPASYVPVAPIDPDGR